MSGLHSHSKVQAARAFTFVEVLAALTFLAILVPTLLGAISIANRAGVMAERSANAAQLAQNKLNELVLDNGWTTAETRGDFGEEWPSYRWELAQSAWDVNSTTSGITQLTLSVFFTVQGHEHTVRLTTLATVLPTAASAASPSPSPAATTR